MKISGNPHNYFIILLIYEITLNYFQNLPINCQNKNSSIGTQCIREVQRRKFTEEVSRFQRLSLNPKWLVWKGIQPKTRSNTHGVDNWLMAIFPQVVELNLVKCRQRFGWQMSNPSLAWKKLTFSK